MRSLEAGKELYFSKERAICQSFSQYLTFFAWVPESYNNIIKVKK